MIEECEKNPDAAAYEKNVNQYVKIPPIKKQMIIMIKLKTGQQAKRKFSIGYLFIYITEFPVDRIDNDLKNKSHC